MSTLMSRWSSPCLENGLAALLISRNTERRVLGRELRERDAELLLVGLGLRLDRDLDDRLGELHALQNDGLLQIAKRVAGARVLEAASATMSPEKASLMSSRLLACISSMRPTRSLRSLVEFSTVVPDSILPE